MTQQHRGVRRAAFLIGAALLGIHFTFAALSQAPLSPAKVRYHETVSAYLEPYFAQNWMLFAPDPLTEDRGILTRAKCADGKVTSFYDVTTPYLKEEQGSLLFPSRMSRLVTTGLERFNDSDALVDRVRKKSRNDKKPLLPRLPHEKKTRQESIAFLSRYSLDQTARIPGACKGKPHAVQVRMYNHRLPPWSQRNAPKASNGDKVEVEDLPWRKTEFLR
ncbi:MULTISPECIES: DUF5819 family protein [unclassified Streptomyces]|uniref:DUF5819 family protein n=1 Tax=unclassified Streptomyces TaxID=2593676 RepID=UPI002DD9057F|nr:MULTISPECIES: DUF5819 family protein [unclassified Streptomyces]WSA90687.1 DUF5819 family protein [Streptomyces sp. NBC_01795]WSB75012.1 DUF5819 family protein [Streptomyces sp. NBC_01775]WSS16709.1 DUF5819 family protein [Streptomyces sp. NBC_01186]WSS45527.1 DUF5819 family protein [Streptomyces sp. NBC_01187]